ncbi:hypothetical protein [Methanolobus psychrotolerans]|uniref:hypothetical protein n=1 Tax=Methanolobus psychrotolerans TaxID=1874706 RepID=UPI00101AE49D|nr:hypothetical protein [Methanolobus psychrotolerans]
MGEKINPLFKHISEHRLPKEMKDAVISKIDDFVPSGYDVSDLLKMISINETIYHFSQQTYSSERIFSLYIYIYIYILNDGRPVVSDFVTKTYFIISFNSPFRFGGGGISYYSLTTISAGYLETFYSKRRLTICLNDQVLGYFDYTNRVLCDSMELQTVFFKKPRVLL